MNRIIGQLIKYILCQKSSSKSFQELIKKIAMYAFMSWVYFSSCSYSSNLFMEDQTLGSDTSKMKGNKKNRNNSKNNSQEDKFKKSTEDQKKKSSIVSLEMIEESDNDSEIQLDEKDSFKNAIEVYDPYYTSKNTEFIEKVTDDESNLCFSRVFRIFMTLNFVYMIVLCGISIWHSVNIADLSLSLSPLELSILNAVSDISYSRNILNRQCLFWYQLHQSSDVADSIRFFCRSIITGENNDR